MSEPKWARSPEYDKLGPENDVHVDPRFVQRIEHEQLPKEWESVEQYYNCLNEFYDMVYKSNDSHDEWSQNIRTNTTDTRPYNCIEGAD